MIKSYLFALLVFVCDIAGAQTKKLDVTLTDKKVKFKATVFESNDVYDDYTYTYTSLVVSSPAMAQPDTFEANKHILKIEFRDFDGNGHKDIITNYRSDGGAYTRDTILQQYFFYDPVAKRFKEPTSWAAYSNAKPLKSNPKLYYSFVSTGCDASDFESYLFSIKDFEIVYLGHIKVFGCEVAPKEIQVNNAIEYLIDDIMFTEPEIVDSVITTDSVVTEDSVITVDILVAEGDNTEYANEGGKKFDNPDYDKNIPDYKSRLTFLDKYWNENWKKFIVEKKEEEEKRY